MISSICLVDECIGCGLCESKCPKNAITMKIQNGFYRPVISDDCVECNNCIKACIANQETIEKNDFPREVYAAYCKDDTLHYQSTSGGLAYKIAYEFIKNGGAVVGVRFNSEKLEVEHCIYENLEELSAMRGSKYVQSNKNNIYKAVKDKLKEKNVLFIGVPCEVYAMKQYLKDNQYKNRLFCIDILCHGGSSPQCFQEHIKKVSFGEKIKNVSFRGGKYDCRLTVWNDNGKKKYSIGQFTDPYFLMFMKRSILQEACYNCKFIGSTRVGDITLGDFWGLDPKILATITVRGVNMVFVNTNAGSELLETVRRDIVLIERPLEEAVEGNETLKEPTHKPEEYEQLWTLIHSKGFHKAINDVYKIDWRIQIVTYSLRKMKHSAAQMVKNVLITITAHKT